MSSLVVFSGTADGLLRCNNATYLTARSGGGTFLTNTSATTAICGQEFFSGQYYCYECFFGFDTSSLGAGASVSAAVLSLYGSSAQVGGSSAGIYRARLHDWGATVDTADWVPGASLSGKTLLAHLAHSSVSQSAYNDFVDDAFAANVNKTGTTNIEMTTDRMEAATVPTAAEYETWVMADNAGTTQDPKLTVTYSTYTPTDPFGVSGFFGV